MMDSAGTKGVLERTPMTVQFGAIAVLGIAMFFAWDGFLRLPSDLVIPAVFFN